MYQGLLTNLLDILALKFGKELAETFLISINADGRENTLDILGRRRGITGKAEKEISCEVLHSEIGSFFFFFFLSQQY